jgi:hypothetical protein
MIIRKPTEINEEEIDTDLKDFCWVAEHLLSTHDKVHGCEILIPETYFFVKGKPKYMAKSDKNGFLTSVRHHDKLELTEIRKDLPQYVRNRKVKEVAIDPDLIQKQNNSIIIYPNDIARVTYAPENGKRGNISILGEKAMLRMFTTRKNDLFWKNVVTIQANIPCKIAKVQRSFKYNFEILSDK